MSRVLGITIPPPPKLPTAAPSTGKLVALGTLVVALANGPAFVALVTPRPEPPPAATKADVDALRAEIRGMKDSVDSLRKYLREKHNADEAYQRTTNRALDKLAGSNEVLTGPKTPYPLPP